MTEPTESVDATPAGRAKYSRVLLKLGGEMFGGGQVGLDPDVVARVARQIAEVVRTGVQVAVVIGGGVFPETGFLVVIMSLITRRVGVSCHYLSEYKCSLPTAPMGGTERATSCVLEFHRVSIL